MTPDLWSYLQSAGKPVVLYGMGNGADKILNACTQKGIPVADFFASDGFVRGQSFHGKTVRSKSQIFETYGADRLIVLLAFGSSRPEVLELIQALDRETELYAPDVPVFGDGLFDGAFFDAHREELDAARALLSDAESRKIFDRVVEYKLTGKLSCLFDAESDPEEVREHLIRPDSIRAAVDLGAYRGETVRELIDISPSLRTVYAVEPDERNYRKLAEYAESETRARVIPFRVGAWSESAVLTFDDSGNRNASFGQNRSGVLTERPHRTAAVQAEPLDRILGGAPVDYIKYDVEGAEREALLGSVETVRACAPRLAVSLYHRNEDLFALPLLIRRLFPSYRGYYLRRYRGVPAWDLNLYLLP